MRRNVEVNVSFGGLHEKHAVQRGVLGTNSAFAQGPRKTTIFIVSARTPKKTPLPTFFHCRMKTLLSHCSRILTLTKIYNHSILMTMK
jgi:hypothetical protein